MCGRYGIDSDKPKQAEKDFNISFMLDDANIYPSMLLPSIINGSYGLVIVQHKDI